MGLIITIFLLLCVVIWTVGYIGEKQYDDIKDEIEKLNIYAKEAYIKLDKINHKINELNKKIES